MIAAGTAVSDHGDLIYPIRQTSYAFAMFSVGLAGGRAHWLDDGASVLRRAKPWIPVLLVAAVGANGVFASFFERQGSGPTSWLSLVVEICAALGTPTLAALYVLATLWVLQRPANQRRLNPLGELGRTTLTHYLGQSLIGMGLLHQIATAPPGPITPTVGVAVSIAILIGQTALSVWWLRGHCFGPVEWFWRSLTYGKRQPLLYDRPLSK